MQPSQEQPESGAGTESDAEQQPSRHDHRRLVLALLAYAALAVLAGIRLHGRPRLVVWLFLGLFAVKTLLSVLKQRAH